MTAAAAMEPTSALDPVSTLVVEQLACELKETCTLVVVTHNMQQAARISDSVAFFLLGELIEHAPTAQLFKNPTDPRAADYLTGRFGWYHLVKVPLGLRCGHAGRKGVQHDLLRRGR